MVGWRGRGVSAWVRISTLKALGATDYAAAKVAAYSRCWWHNSDRLLKTVLTIAYVDQLGVPRLS